LQHTYELGICVDFVHTASNYFEGYCILYHRRYLCEVTHTVFSRFSSSPLITPFYHSGGLLPLSKPHPTPPHPTHTQHTTHSMHSDALTHTHINKRTTKTHTRTVRSQAPRISAKAAGSGKSPGGRWCSFMICARVYVCIHVCVCVYMYSCVCVV